MPQEMSVADIYFSPLLLVMVLAVSLTWITVTLLNKTRLSRFVTLPSLMFMAITLLYVLAIDSWWLQF